MEVWRNPILEQDMRGERVVGKTAAEVRQAGEELLFMDRVRRQDLNQYQKQEGSRRQETQRPLHKIMNSLALAPSAPACARCQGPVYLAELQRAADQVWHSRCFTCSRCSKSLVPGSCCTSQGKIYCSPCYQFFFGPKGIGYGMGASLQTRD